MIRKAYYFIILSLLPLALANGAIELHDFETQEQEQRFKKLADELRCPKCLNSNLSGSNAPIAEDLRREIEKQILEGRSNEEIIEFMSSRYGDFILYRPRVTPGTYILWFGPLVLLLLGVLIIHRMLRHSQKEVSDQALSDEESQKLQEILAASRKDK